MPANHPVTHPHLKIGGITPLTTIDYPGELSAVIFLQGCPWRCGYCQNTDLLPRDNNHNIHWHEVANLLEKRQGLLDAVVFSGGEPTLHTGLEEAIQQVKSMGYKIGLHTAGIYPERLQKLLPLLDWVGMDIKSNQAGYHQITGVKGSGQRAWESAQLLMESGVAHEYRVTVHSDMLDDLQLNMLLEELTTLGAKHVVIQECVTRNCFDEKLRTTKNNGINTTLLNKFSSRFPNFTLRKAIAS